MSNSEGTKSAIVLFPLTSDSLIAPRGCSVLPGVQFSLSVLPSTTSTSPSGEMEMELTPPARCGSDTSRLRTYTYTVHIYLENCLLISQRNIQLSSLSLEVTVLTKLCF